MNRELSVMAFFLVIAARAEGVAGPLLALRAAQDQERVRFAQEKAAKFIPVGTPNLYLPALSWVWIE